MAGPWQPLAIQLELHKAMEVSPHLCISMTGPWQLLVIPAYRALSHFSISMAGPLQPLAVEIGT